MTDTNTTPLRVGDTLYGLCEGCFGRDSYSDKRVEAVGADWVIVRYEDGGIDCYGGAPEDLCEYRDPELCEDNDY